MDATQGFVPDIHSLMVATVNQPLPPDLANWKVLISVEVTDRPGVFLQWIIDGGRWFVNPTRAEHPALVLRITEESLLRTIINPEVWPAYVVARWSGDAADIGQRRNFTSLLKWLIEIWRTSFQPSLPAIQAEVVRRDTEAKARTEGARKAEAAKKRELAADGKRNEPVKKAKWNIGALPAGSGLAVDCPSCRSRHVVASQDVAGLARKRSDGYAIAGPLLWTRTLLLIGAIFIIPMFIMGVASGVLTFILFSQADSATGTDDPMLAWGIAIVGLAIMGGFFGGAERISNYLEVHFGIPVYRYECPQCNHYIFFGLRGRHFAFPRTPIIAPAIAAEPEPIAEPAAPDEPAAPAAPAPRKPIDASTVWKSDT